MHHKDMHDHNLDVCVIHFYKMYRQLLIAIKSMIAKKMMFLYLSDWCNTHN